MKGACGLVLVRKSPLPISIDSIRIQKAAKAGKQERKKKRTKTAKRATLSQRAFYTGLDCEEKGRKGYGSSVNNHYGRTDELSTLNGTGRSIWPKGYMIDTALSCWLYTNMYAPLPSKQRWH